MIKGTELFTRDIAPVTASMLSRTPGARGEVLDTVHTQTSATVAGRHDALAARQSVHVRLTQWTERLTTLKRWRERSAEVVFERGMARHVARAGVRAMNRIARTRLRIVADVVAERVEVRRRG